MFTVRTTAGLNTAASTPEAVAAALGQHLHDMATDEPIKWWIQTPAGTTHGGHVDLHGMRDNVFIAQTVQQVAANLSQELRADRTDQDRSDIVTR